MAACLEVEEEDEGSEAGGEGREDAKGSGPKHQEAAVAEEGGEVGGEGHPVGNEAEEVGGSEAKPQVEEAAAGDEGRPAEVEAMGRVHGAQGDAGNEERRENPHGGRVAETADEGQGHAGSHSPRKGARLSSSSPLPMHCFRRRPRH